MAQGVGKGFTRDAGDKRRRLSCRGQGRQYASISRSDTRIRFSTSCPPGVSAKVERQVLVTLEGADRQLLGMVAAQLRELRPPEPYKGKGIKYAEEKIRRKAGKAAAGSSGGLEAQRLWHHSGWKSAPRGRRGCGVRCVAAIRCRGFRSTVRCIISMLRSSRTSRAARWWRPRPLSPDVQGRAQDGARLECGQSGRQDDRGALPGQGNQPGGLRPQRVSVSWPDQSPGRCRARSGAEILAYVEQLSRTN